jgi:hypothetical protein
MEKFWRTTNGKYILISKLDNNHLLNIKKFIERLAKDGMVIMGADIFRSPDSYYVEEKYGDEVKRYLNYDAICNEIKKRKLL